MKEFKPPPPLTKKENAEISVFGYKHHKILKFIATLLRCLRHCFDQKHDNLNMDLNQYLLLKNEISLAFLRKFETIITTTKAAIKIYCAKEEAKRKEMEQQELNTLEKIIKSPNALQVATQQAAGVSSAPGSATGERTQAQ